MGWKGSHFAKLPEGRQLLLTFRRKMTRRQLHKASDCTSRSSATVPLADDSLRSRKELALLGLAFSLSAKLPLGVAHIVARHLPPDVDSPHHQFPLPMPASDVRHYRAILELSVKLETTDF